MDYKRYRSYAELLADADNVTDAKEMLRLSRICKIPTAARSVLEQRVMKIDPEIVVLEAERDSIINFLNGEWDE